MKVELKHLEVDIVTEKEYSKTKMYVAFKSATYNLCYADSGTVNAVADIAASDIVVTVVDNSHNHTSDNISDATNLSTANMIVKRDASGNFSAGTINATNLVLSRDLTVNGTTTSVDTTNLLIDNK